MYSFKSLNLNTKKVVNYDKLKVDVDEAMSEKVRLEGQLNQAVMKRDCYKAERDFSRSEKAKLEEKIA